MENAIRGALWSFFAGDALSSPSHWFYGGPGQIRQVYGKLLTTYTKPSEFLQGSIMSKSDTDGGGRGNFHKSQKTIIGDVINHGKKKYWTSSYHYHATLRAGENTLEAQLARVLMKSIVSTKGQFDADDFRRRYIAFMTTPGSHNDAYASTCHRMFFKNLENGLPEKECPDNDGHNVDTIDGLVLPTISALAEIYVSRDRRRAQDAAVRTAQVTRNSRPLDRAASFWSDILYDVITQHDDPLGAAGTRLGMSPGQLAVWRRPMTPDPVVACYLASSLPAAVGMAYKFVANKIPVWDALLANANAGGENVHRGSILGAVLGAHAGSDALPTHLISDLADADDLHVEINAFLTALNDATSRGASS